MPPRSMLHWKLKTNIQIFKIITIKIDTKKIKTKTIHEALRLFER